MSNGTLPAWETTPTVVPPALAQAIEQAAMLYHVPPDLLAGIWRVESGSTYPNPYVNQYGHGGLFGTPASQVSVSAPALQQAEASATDLVHALIGSGGNIAAALHTYSGSGYSSVPGETTFGRYLPPASEILAQAPKPFAGGFGGIVHGVEGVSSAVTHPIRSAQQAAGAIAQDVSKPVLDAGKAVVVATWQLVGAYVVRFVETIGGLVLIMLGLIMVGRVITATGPARSLRASATVLRNAA